MNAMAALDRAHKAWLATQPQLTLEGVLDCAPLTDSKNGTRREHACRTGRTIEPANHSPHLSQGGGLESARRDMRTDGVSRRPAAPTFLCEVCGDELPMLGNEARKATLAQRSSTDYPNRLCGWCSKEAKK